MKTLSDVLRVGFWFCMMSISAVSYAAAGRDAQVVLIGFGGPLSGSFSGVGKSMSNAVQMAIDETNKRGMQIQGKPVLFKQMAQDDRADPRTAEFIARYLVKEGAVAVIGHWNSAASLAVAPIYDAAGIVQISPATMSRLYTKQGRRAAFRTIGNNDGAGTYTAEYAVKVLQAKRVSLIDDSTPFGRGFSEQFGKTARELGAQVVSTHSISDKTSDFSRLLLDIKQRNPDVIFFGGLDMQAALLAQGIKRLSLKARLVGASGTVGLPFLRVAGAAGNGAVVLEPGLPLDKMPGWKAFEKNYQQKFDTTIDLYAPFAYDAVQVLIAAIKQADSVDPKTVAASLHNIKFSGMTGPISFNTEGDLKQPVFTIYEVQDQRWVPVKIIGSTR